MTYEDIIPTLLVLTILVYGVYMELRKRKPEWFKQDRPHHEYDEDDYPE
ncbi:MAG: hypothetical protein ABFD24_06195 [Anaerolineaceae bacterium]